MLRLHAPAAGYRCAYALHMAPVAPGPDRQFADAHFVPAGNHRYIFVLCKGAIPAKKTDASAFHRRRAPV